MTKITQKLALGLMISTIIPASQAAEFFLRKQPGFEKVQVRNNEEAAKIISRPELVALQAQKPQAERLDLSTRERVEDYITAIDTTDSTTKAANPKEYAEAVHENAGIDGRSERKGYYTKVELAAAPERKDEIRAAEKAGLDIADVANTKRTMAAVLGDRGLTPDQKKDPAVIKLVHEEVKAGRGVPADLGPRLALAKTGCRDNSPEAIRALGFINANDRANINFDTASRDYIGGDKNLNIETLAAFVKLGNDNPPEDEFLFVRGVIDNVNKINDQKKYPLIMITPELVDMAFHVNRLHLGLDEERFADTVIAYDYLVNGLGIVRANLDAHQEILATLHPVRKKLKEYNFYNTKAADSFHAVDVDFAAAAIQLALTPALAGRANFKDVTDKDLKVVREAFNRVAGARQRIGDVAGIGFDAAAVAVLRKIRYDFQIKDPAKFNQHHIVAVRQHTDNTHPQYIAGVKKEHMWVYIDASARLRHGGVVPPTADNVKASVYLANLKHAVDWGIDSTNAGQIAAAIAMQNVAFDGGEPNPSAGQVVQYVALQAAGIALNKANVNASVYLECLKDIDNWGIDSTNADQIAAVEEMQDAAFDGGEPKPSEGQVVQCVALQAAGIALNKANVNASIYLADFGVPAVAALHNVPDAVAAIAAVYSGDIDFVDLENANELDVQSLMHLRTFVNPDDHTELNFKGIKYLKTQQDPAGARAVAAPTEEQAGIVGRMPDERAKALAAWKIQKENGRHAGYIPVAVAQYLSKAGGNVKFGFRRFAAGGGFAANPAHLVGNSFEVAEANLAALPRAAITPGEVVFFDDLNDDGVPPSTLVTLVGGDNR